MTALRTHLEESILGWWSEEGADDQHGGVRTCFTNRGELISREKYTWSQGRWAWTCALVADEIDAGRITGHAELWRGRAFLTADFLAAHAFLPDGRTSFRLSETGEHLADEHGEYATSVFADLFAALGLAGAARVALQDGKTAGRADSWAKTAGRTVALADTSIRDRSAKSAPYPVPGGFRDLAGSMTLIHVAGELHRTSPSAVSHRALNDARRALLDGTGAFLGPESWWEFRPDHPSGRDTLLARHVTPGHLLELLWMLVHVGDMQPDLAVPEATLSALALRALEAGWDRQEGGLLRYVDRETGGAPSGRLLATPYEELVKRTWDSKLWWVHAEAMYSTALLARRTGSPDLENWARVVRDYTLATFPHPGGKEWIQIRSRDGSPLDEVVALPVKDPMHIARSLLLLNALEHDAPASERTQL
ncbi:AGE family epimerase/isomerase [Brachybacterium muris]|uniref:AGE family epimerase/isomerase n=1 Tax=Brachybacterium muris TaxID=219301 RepID=UPI00223B9792|nr:AGE family epimerase/isomerase [Brachybacterium muris]MCT2262757.1 AGE family epimerase/isomerase [Brachybacterium muris]